MNTGQEVGDWTNQSAPSGTGVLTIDNNSTDVGYDPTPVDQKTGIITLNASVVASMNLASASLRIFYRTQKDWGMQIQKATAHYKEASSPANVDFRTYYVGDGTTGSATRVYFAPCDAGKSVILGEFYVNGNSAPFRNQTFQITENPQQFDVVAGAQQPLPYIDITTAVSGATGA